MIIQAEKDKPALNDDTILLTEERKPLGRVSKRSSTLIFTVFCGNFSIKASLEFKGSNFDYDVASANLM